MSRGHSAPFGMVVMCAVLVACSQGNVPSVVAEHSPLPPLKGRTLQGPEVAPGLYADKVLVVNFWASWCGPCRSEQPALQQVYKRFSDDGVRFVGVNWRDQSAAAKAWIERFGVTYPNVFDPSGAVGASFAIAGAPDTFIVDRTGTIRWAVFGATSASQITTLIQQMLSLPSPSPSP